MHIIGIITAIAVAIYWIRRATNDGRDITNAATSLKNAPRRNKFRKASAKRGIDLIDNPMEAATILMISLAHLSNYSRHNGGNLSPQAEGRIKTQLTRYMSLRPDDAEDMLVQMRWTVKDLKQPESALQIMIKLLQGNISRDETDDLSDMMRKVSHADGEPNDDQRAFIDTFRNRMGL